MRREDGQTSAEYMGILLLVAAIVAVIAPGIPSQVSGRIGHLVSCLGIGGCEASGGGVRPCVPPKSSRGQPKKVPVGGRGGAKGDEDADGNIWVWNPPGSPGAHGGPHRE